MAFSPLPYETAKRLMWGLNLAALVCTAVVLGRHVLPSSWGAPGRRVALALACRPDQALWLLDEPLAGLDQATVDGLADLFAGHLQQGGGLVFSSHDRSLSGARVLQLGPATDQHHQGKQSVAPQRSEAPRHV